MNDTDIVLALAAEVVAVAISAMVVFGFVTWMLLRAATLAPAAMVTLALSLITIIAIAAYGITREEVMVAVIGTGIGALAGAVTAQLGTKDEDTSTQSVRAGYPS